MNTPGTALSNNSEAEFRLLLENEEEETYQYNEVLDKMNKKSELEQELVKYRSIVMSDQFAKSEKSTKDFWIEFSEKLPNLYKLANILLNICASSAFIERFFSICGLICKDRSLAMSDDLIVTRCLMAANISVLEELNNLCRTDEDYDL